MALLQYWAFWIASPILEASGYFSLLELDVKLRGLIIRWHGRSSKSTCHFLKSGTCKQACVWWTLACEGNRQQLAMLFVKQSVDPLPRDWEEPVALPVVPENDRGYQILAFPQLLSKFWASDNVYTVMKKEAGHVFIPETEDTNLYLTGLEYEDLEVLSLTIASNTCFERGYKKTQKVPFQQKHFYVTHISGGLTA